MKRLIPLADRVLVQKLKAESKTASGVFLPESTKSSFHQAKVVAVGQGRRMTDGKIIPCSVKVGDTVVIPEYGGLTMKLEDQEYHVFRDDDLIGIMGN